MTFGGTFEGSVNLPLHRKTAMRRDVPVAVELPESLRVPLCVDGKRSAKCVVAPGDVVAAGEPLGEFSGGGYLVAPVSGIVGEIVRTEICVGRGCFEVDAVEMHDLHYPTSSAEPSPEPESESRTSEELFELLSRAGLFVRGERITELGRWMSHIRKSKATRLVVSLLEDEPYASSRHAVAAHFGKWVALGARAIAKACGLDTIEILVDASELSAYDELAAEAGMSHIAVEVKFPIATKRLLKQFAGRGSAILDGIVACQAGQSLCGELTCRGSVVTVAGENQNSPRVILVPDGMALRDIVADAAGPMIAGGAMRGQLARETAVTSAGLELLLSMDPPRNVSMEACMSCGWCRDHCPAKLNVSLLNDCFELGRIEVAQHHGVEQCLDCGACSYVCPSRLALRARMSELIEAVRRLRSAIGRDEQ
ncbi:MAG: 4Fe-4S dicluster domain-containing protein [Phycisphaerales bacterium]|nr:4Fe-4S dicluster domain-containing protein [Phycisphaerales bacterium]